MATIRSLFSGGEGVGVGARAASLTVLPGIEYNQEIASVAEMNGFKTILANILDVDPRSLERSNVLHASPECTRASNANANAGETQLDIDLGRKIAEFIQALLPDYFTLENVYQYRKFKAWQIIAGALNSNGYWFDLAHVSMADYGVPQTRKRMIVRAVKGGWVPPLPSREKWIGWYEAIEDLIPTLPESRFANWQLEHLPEAIKKNILVSGQNSNAGRTLTIRPKDQPATTVTASASKGFDKAFLIGPHSGFREGQKVYRNEGEPVGTLTAGHNILQYRAFITDSRNPRHQNNGKMTIRRGEEPVFAIPASSAPERYKTWLGEGRIVSMTPRALARFQAIPDDYNLPEKKTLACKVIGNSVPPLFYEKMIGGLVR